MKKVFLSFLFFQSLFCYSQQTQGLIVNYLQPGTEEYHQALSNIFKVVLSDGVVSIVNPKGESTVVGNTSDIKVIKFGLVEQNNVGISNNNSVFVKAYPNPTTNLVVFDGVPDGEDILFYSISGELLFITKDNCVYLENYSSGVYFAKISDSIFRIVKE